MVGVRGVPCFLAGTGLEPPLSALGALLLELGTQGKLSLAVPAQPPPLSAVLLVGLVLNATLGWSWADPIAALVIAAVAVKEGRDAWQGKGCCATPAAAVASPASVEDDSCGCRPGCDCCG